MPASKKTTTNATVAKKVVPPKEEPKKVEPEKAKPKSLDELKAQHFADVKAHPDQAEAIRSHYKKEAHALRLSLKKG